jgi:site-specific DNA recombinase
MPSCLAASTRPWPARIVLLLSMRTGLVNPNCFILTRKLFDETGDRLTPTHTLKKGRKIRYYVSNRLISGGADPSGWRLSAPNLEKQVADIIADHLESKSTNYTLTKIPDLQEADLCHGKAAAMINRLRSKEALQYRQLIESVHVLPKTIRIKLNVERLAENLGVNPEKLSDELVGFEMAWTFRRRGVENKIVVGAPHPEPDQVLIRILAMAHQWAQEMREGMSLSAIAKRKGVTPGYIRTRSKLAFLSPKIQRAIVEGTLLPEFTTNKIMQMKMPRDWHQQHTLFGL